MLLNLDPHPPLRGKSEGLALGCGIAGIVVFGLAREFFADFVEVLPGIAMAIVVLAWGTFYDETIGFSRPLFRVDDVRVWLGRAAFTVGALRLLFARTLGEFALAMIVFWSIYLVGWAAVGPDNLFTSTGWRLLRAPSKWRENLQALLSGKPLPIRKPTITAYQWISHTYGICKEIDRWTDRYALRRAVIDTLQFRECLAHYGDRLDPDLQRAAREFARSLETRHVESAAREFVRVYRSRNRRTVLRR